MFSRANLFNPALYSALAKKSDAAPERSGTMQIALAKLSAHYKQLQEKSPRFVLSL
jgi:hypothetical protein